MQKLSSLNIILAIIYVLVYLKSGTFNSTSGILMIIIFNWLGLRSFHKDDFQWRVWHYLIGGCTTYFIGTLIYGAINILQATITYNFITTDTLTYLVINFVFCVLVMIQLIIYAYKNYRELKLN